MSKLFNLIIIFCIFFNLTQCTNKNPVSPAEEFLGKLTSLDKNVIDTDRNFGLKLFKEIAKEEDGNIFVSPLSVSMALGMTYNGAGGSTKEAMHRTLEYGSLDIKEVNESYKKLIELLTGLDSKVKFQIANSIWYRQEWTFEEVFLNLCRTYFNAEVSGLDFNAPNAKNIINGWVNDNTNGKIKEIVDIINGEDVMFLINAIYFKGTWKYEFDVSKTKDDLFTLPDGSKKPCRMMIQEGDFQYFQNDDFQAVDLPYGDGNFSMTILLPHPEKDINQLITQLNDENWNLWMNSFTKQQGTLELPRFKLKYEKKLNDALNALGMGIAFNGQADFTEMYKPGGLFISRVKHKTFVEVNEEGTEAAAVTSVVVSYESVEPSGFSMRIDRPFIFVIRENLSNTMLFVGKIVEPTLE